MSYSNPRICRGLAVAVYVLSIALIFSWLPYFSKGRQQADVVDAIIRSDKNKLRELNRHYNIANNPIGGNYAIIYAIELDNIGVVFDMLNDKYNLDVMNDLGATPLNTAIISSSPNLVRRLIQSGAHPNYKIWMSPLYLSVMSFESSREKIDILMSSKAVFFSAEEKAEAIAKLNKVNANINEYITKLRAVPVVDK